ncbi:hypothetical protein [Rheinheimera oceanensis]|uniref:hypothetical protein n=1 Tax=Rheinheimera oceanensis TaxID=2817449 RepID=UPI001BFD2269|nr:hypothetical protein [Rheinheimera oceanensis]
MLTAFLSFLGVVIGALLQYFFTRHIESQRHLRDLRSKAYMDYLKCVCEHAQFRPIVGTHEQKELFSRTGDAKSRICLYGSKEAVAAFSRFEELGASMATTEQRDAFTNMVSIMRTDSGSEVCVNNTDLQNVLLGVHK